MTQRFSLPYLKYSVAAAGLLALGLRLVLLQTGVDSKGLLITGHWADTAVWLLTAAVIGVIFFFLRGCTGPASDAVAFPASTVRSIGCLLAGFGFLLSPSPAISASRLALAEPILRLLAAGAMVAVGFCRFRGKRSSVLFHGTVCLYLALRMVCRYQIWSSDPQLQHYVFYLGAHVALMLSCYQLAAFDADSGSHRGLWSWSLGAVYLCLAALPGCDDPFFLLCGALWMFSCLSSLTPAAAEEH